jgi:hypothetical protein
LGNAHASLHEVFPVWEMLMRVCMGFFRFGKCSCEPAWAFSGLGNAHASRHGLFPVWEMLMHVGMFFFPNRGKPVQASIGFSAKIFLKRYEKI